MVARFACDICEVDLDGPGRVMRRLGDVTVEVMVARKGVWNGGHLCHVYAVEVIQKGDRVGYDNSYPTSRQAAGDPDPDENPC